jgi:GT2 family glycosyltransferase
MVERSRSGTGSAAFNVSLLQVKANEPARFDLVVASVDRSHELRTLLDSLERQTERSFRLLVVDQNEDERLAAVLADYPSLNCERIRAERGLSRARNAALAHLGAEIVAFPDDDCAYPDDLLERVRDRLAGAPELGGLNGRSADWDGYSSPSWRRDPALLTPTNLWNRSVSFAIFLRRSVIEQVGRFDERLGLGSDGPWSSGEEIDYLIRAVAVGVRIAYDPDLIVFHPRKTLSPGELRSLGYRDGASVGFLLRKHRYPLPALLPMLARPVGGAALALARGNPARSRFHLATFRGRVAGYLGRSR